MMSPDPIKQLPSGSLNLVLSSQQSLPVLRIPDVKEPFAGRRGKQLANETREKYFLMWHKLVLERLAVESAVVLNDYVMQVVDQAINQMLDRFYSTKRLPEAEAFMKDFTQVCIQQMVANVRAILDNHSRAMGEFY
jgi:hypothetical protein